MDFFDDSEMFVDINGMSKHFGGEQQYNETNPGLGLTIENVDDRLVKALMAGKYKNSYGDPSYYVGGHIARRFGRNYYADLGVAGGAITGYAGKKITPMAAVMAQIGKKDLGRLKFMYVPRVEDKDPSLLMMNLSIPTDFLGRK